MDSDISTILLPNGRKLYLSNVFTASQANIIDAMRIKAIVSLGDEPAASVTDHRVKVSVISVPDTEESSLAPFFPSTRAFIRQALDEDPDPETGVLVHCFAGISRSLTIVCAYLIAEFGMKAYEALAYVRRFREIVKPNSRFMQELMQYEKECTTIYLLTMGSDESPELFITRKEAMDDVAKLFLDVVKDTLHCETPAEMLDNRLAFSSFFSDQDFQIRMVTVDLSKDIYIMQCGNYFGRKEIVTQSLDRWREVVQSWDRSEDLEFLTMCTYRFNAETRELSSMYKRSVDE